MNGIPTGTRSIAETIPYHLKKVERRLPKVIFTSFPKFVNGTLDLYPTKSSSIATRIPLTTADSTPPSESVFDQEAFQQLQTSTIGYILYCTPLR